ncbi:tetratricopeptide repeat protein 39B-like protein [Leptotrombidium deliense]|uniref:Tetratricopeptide repeat protein 39B-like protein n=1 Tax=Leptotrombidium deliense TaxID=299467 RepID=A0A443SBY5_9ACAR|nr:tetratricopeptide repeat protein 39B-like protein [Leptotrombidium deliense]
MNELFTLKVFEDAKESCENGISGRKVPNLQESIEEIVYCLDLALNNKFEQALKITEKLAKVSLYHALGKATLCFLKGMLTLETEEIENALCSLKNLADVCNEKRKTSNTVTRVVWRPNYNNYSDDEVHAELCFAETQLEIALLTFLEDQNLINLVKGAFRIRACFQSYKECNYILKTKNNWKSEVVRKHFESGTRMGIGTFNLIISHLPTRVLKLLEFVGFSGNRSIGFKELELATEMCDGLRAPLAALIMMVYHCYVEHFFGLGDTDLEYVTKLVNKWLDKYPNSAFYLLFAARVNQLRGNITKAIPMFNKCISIQNEWKQIHNICYWELLWCYTLYCDWKNAAHFADILRKQCNWSRATYTYQYATNLYMIAESENNDELKAKATEIIQTVPSLRHRYAGKTIPAEKFAITKSIKYMEQDEHLLLPALEFLYIWNIFAILEKCNHLVNPMLKLIEQKLNQYKYEKDLIDHSVDNYALALLLKGSCLRLLNCPLQCEECFLEIITLEKRIETDTFLAPHAALEIGLSQLKRGQYSSSKQWFEKARRDYSGYLLETLVHFRIHCALRLIKENEKSEKRRDSQTTLSEKRHSFENIESKKGKISTFQQMARKFRRQSSSNTFPDYFQSYDTKL